MESKEIIEHDQIEYHEGPFQGLAGSAQLFSKNAEGDRLEIRLIPRPTNDPRDPLVWSAQRKYLAYTTLAFFVFMSNFTTISAGPCLEAIAEEFDISQTQGSYMITVAILMLGLGNLFWVPLARKYGKRPVLIVASAMFFAMNIWSAVANSYSSLLASKILAGFGASVSETLGASVVADLFFLHQRGRMVGIFNFMISFGSALAGLFAGFVMVGSNGNWRWVNWMNSILTGVCFLLILFFQPETAFERTPESELGNEAAQEVTEETILEARANYSWRKSLAVMPYHDREGSLAKFYWRPMRLVLYPAVIWGALTYGVGIGWIVFQQNANPSIFAKQYKFQELGIGNINLAAVVGAFVGCLLGGPMLDYITANIAKRRGGVFTPEMRLWTLLPIYIFGPIGLLMWGGGIHANLHWSVPVTGFGITYGIVCAVPSVGITYVIDCYRPVAGEALTALIAVKNTFGFGLGFAVFPWLAVENTLEIAGWQTLIEAAIFLSTIPLFIYGAKIRQITNN